MALNTQKIQNNIRKLRKLLKKSAKLRSPDRVHQLRTRTRRIESILLAASMDSRRNERRLLRQLGLIRKRAGKVGNMDVLTGYILNLPIQQDKERECAVRLVEYLGANRLRMTKRLRRAVRSQGSKARARLKRLSRKIESVAVHQNTAADGSKPRDEAAASVLTSADLLAEPNTLNRGNLHPYRLKVKELRYVLKFAHDSADEPLFNALGDCKDAIGEWHDWEKLTTIAAEVLNHAPRCGLIAQLKGISEQKLEKALAITNSMRAQFILSPASRGSRRKDDRSAQSPGIRAAAAIARR